MRRDTPCGQLDHRGDANEIYNKKFTSLFEREDRAKIYHFLKKTPLKKHL